MKIIRFVKRQELTLPDRYSKRFYVY